MITRIQPFQAGVPLGGTTGQVLTKASNTDYDYSWSVVTGGVSDGDKGDITVSGSGSTWTIDDGVITFSKIQNINQFELLGRYSASAGSPQALTLGSSLEMLSNGKIIVNQNKYFNPSTEKSDIDNESIYIQTKGTGTDTYSEIFLGSTTLNPNHMSFYVWVGDEDYLNGAQLDMGTTSIKPKGFINISANNLYSRFIMSEFDGIDYINFTNDRINSQTYTIGSLGHVFNSSTGLRNPITGVKYEFVSSTGGLRLPLHTTTQRNALANVSGNVIWNSTDLSLDINNGTAWNRVVTSDFLGVRVTVGTTAPSSPAVNDLWVDTN
jgi:hypothetical protein